MELLLVSPTYYFTDFENLLQGLTRAICRLGTAGSQEYASWQSEQARGAEVVCSPALLYVFIGKC